MTYSFFSPQSLGRLVVRIGMKIEVLALLLVLLDPTMSNSTPSCNVKGQKDIDWDKDGEVVSTINPTAQGTDSWNETLKEGKLESDRIRFPEYPRGYRIQHVRTHYYQIVDTDYDTWAIEHICSERGSNFVLLLSRKMKDVPNDVMWKVRRSIRKAGVIKGSTWFASGCLTGKGTMRYRRTP
ncbi:hypothetical protein MRX96_020635 [Rhipicephalus microplus]